MSIVDWLCGVEEKVSDIYARAALAFVADEALAGLLRTLAEQEMRHSAILREAFGGRDLLREEELAAVVDPETQRGVIASLDEMMAKVVAGDVSREAMTEMIADTEFYEWNGIFLYAMRMLRADGATYAAAKREIETHLQVIEAFLATFPHGRRILERFRRLPPLDRRKVLVVEDDPALAGLIKSILLREAEVSVAENGRQGLELLRAESFDAIIADVDMPVMDGIDMYRQALRLGAASKERFIFLTANLRPEDRYFFAEQKLTVLRKPSPINRIRQAVLGGARAGGTPIDF